MLPRSRDGRPARPAPPTPPPLLPLLLLVAAAVPPSLAGEPCVPARPGEGESGERRGPRRPPGPRCARRRLSVRSRPRPGSARWTAGGWRGSGWTRRAARLRGRRHGPGSLPRRRSSGTHPGRGRGRAAANLSVGQNSWRTNQCAPARLWACGASAGRKRAAKGHLNIFIHIIEG